MSPHRQSSVYVAEAMEGRLVVMESCAHIPMDEKSEVCAANNRITASLSLMPVASQWSWRVQAALCMRQYHGSRWNKTALASALKHRPAVEIELHSSTMTLQDDRVPFRLALGHVL